MFRTVSNFVFILLLGVVFATRANAYGIGLSSGMAAEKWNVEAEDQNARTFRHRESRDVVHVGFIMDSCLSNKKSTNYRLVGGFETSEAHGHNFSMSGAYVTHTFGFLMLWRDGIRLWAGPQWKLSYYNTMWNDRHEGYVGHLLGMGWGGVLGANFNFAKDFTMSFTGGTRGMSQWGGYHPSTNSNDETHVDAGTDGVFLDVSLVFRLGERGE